MKDELEFHSHGSDEPCDGCVAVNRLGRLFDAVQIHSDKVSATITLKVEYISFCFEGVEYEIREKQVVTAIEGVH